MIRNLLSLIGIFSGIIALYAQPKSDTLTLKMAVERIINYYPTVLQANEAIRSADINYDMARSVYLPIIAGKASYSYIEPISALDLEGRTIHIQAHNNTSIGVSISQLIWDFGKSRPRIEAENIRKELTSLQKQQLLQNLSLQGIRAYYLTALSRHSIRIKQQQLRNFGEMLEQTIIRKTSGSVTDYDYLNTNAGMLAVKSELISLAAEKERQYVSFGLLTDTLINDATLLSLNFTPQKEQRGLDELTQFALTHRIEMQMMQKESEIARLQEKIAGRSFNPSLNAGISGGFNTGYEPNIKKLRANISAGATLQIPIYEGGKRKQEKALSKVGINKAEATLLLTEKEIRQQVADAYYALVSAEASVEQIAIQAEVALKAYQQAKVNYDAGSITNLELLTSETNSSNAQLRLLQEKINRQLAWYQLRVSLGINIYNSDN